MESLFAEIGLSESKAKETAKNAKLAKNLCAVIDLAQKENKATKERLLETGALLYHVASKMKPQAFESGAPMIVRYIVEAKLDSEIRVNAALEYALKNQGRMDEQGLEAAAGVGVKVTPEQVEKAVEDAVKVNKGQILEKRYRFPQGLIMGAVRKALPWADGKAVKNEVEIQILDLLGPKTEADLAPPPKPEKKKKAEEKQPKTKAEKAVNGGKEESGEDSSGAETIAELMKTKVRFHRPGENDQTDLYVVTPETKQILANHLKRTGGRVRTRFPPEPNGLLHIGHAKAININFGYAAANDGVCFLRFDDTNPEKEEEKFFKGIRDVVEWLGYEPFKITHSSDYFPQLYEWAKVLISKDLAFVCHQKVEDIRGFNPPPSPYRNRPVRESLELFEAMKNGKFDEGEATLRLKLTLEEGKVDPVAYRIKYAPHHRTGDEWCIYPTYDYTHCLCDSIEDITHSLCTKEFQNRRSSYYWLCNSLDIYCPVQWEYGRLNVSYTVVSKRKIGRLIESGICKDWDDPRLFTLAALRRRGFPAEAVNNFCARIGVTGAMMTVDPSMLEAVVRQHLNASAPRTMVVLNPVKVVLTNLAAGIGCRVKVPDFPDAPEKGSHEIAFGSTLYIDADDFRAKSEKGYRRLTPDQSVGLKHVGYVIKVNEVVKGSNGEVKQINAEAVPVNEAEKPKAFIHWVADPVQVEVRLYERLFKHKSPEDPAEVPGGFLTDVDPDSLKVLKSMADKSVSESKVYDRYQFERVGFFSVDSDSSVEKGLVFNRTVSLKEDNKKA